MKKSQVHSKSLNHDDTQCQEEYAKWFFDYVCGLAVVSIVSGAIVERCHFWVNCVLPIFLAGMSDHRLLDNLEKHPSDFLFTMRACFSPEFKAFLGQREL